MTQDFTSFMADNALYVVLYGLGIIALFLFLVIIYLGVRKDTAGAKLINSGKEMDIEATLQALAKDAQNEDEMLSKINDTFSAINQSKQTEPSPQATPLNTLQENVPSSENKQAGQMSVTDFANAFNKSLANMNEASKTP